MSHVQRGVVYIVGMIQIKSFAKPRHLLYYGNRPLPKPKSSRACGAVVSAASASAAVSRREYALDIFEELNVRTPHIRPAEHLNKQRYQAWYAKRDKQSPPAKFLSDSSAAYYKEYADHVRNVGAQRVAYK